MWGNREINHIPEAMLKLERMAIYYLLDIVMYNMEPNHLGIDPENTEKWMVAAQETCEV